MSNRLLTKSKYLNGMQCLKYLWFLFNDPSKVPEPDDRTQYLFDQGHMVGELAKKLFPDGISIPAENFSANLSRTKELLSKGKTLFEAGFMAEGLFSRVDILQPAGPGSWDIIEVKSTTGIKDENLHDIAFQRYCLEKAGLKINKCSLAYINNKYVKNGDIDPAAFFTVEDITKEAVNACDGIENRIREMVETIAGSECPEVPVSSFCSSPYACPVTVCWEEMPDNNIFSLYRGGKKCFELYYAGVHHLRQIPDDYKLNASQKIQKSCDISGKPHIDKKAIAEFLAAIKPPVHYLDFETYAPAVPIFDGTRPYQKIPFQFSLHILNDGKISHYGYLAAGSGDPRPQFLTELKNTIEKTGNIITYNQSFEESVLRELETAFPEYTGWVDDVCGRMADLLQPFRSFSCYYPAQNGSASIKSVLPALTGNSYEGMAIADGDTASRMYTAVTFGEASEYERNKVRADLEKYCGQDTEGMVWIIDKLKSLVDKQQMSLDI